MTATPRNASARPPGLHPVNVIFDFDLTLFPEESTLGLAKAAVQQHRQREKLLKFLEPYETRTKSFAPGLTALPSLLSILLSIKQTAISEYCERSACKLESVFLALCRQLKEMDVGVYVISSGYIEVLSRLTALLGIDAQNIAANEFAWWRGTAIGVRPSVLQGSHGKVKTIRRWQACGKLRGPFIMVGDGPADRKVFEHGLAHGFIQADYYRAGASHAPKGNFQVAKTPEQLPVVLHAMLEAMRRDGRPLPAR